jgi:diadenosine tetraphosphate (Ap4A) HIT family hydrolase
MLFKLDERIEATSDLIYELPLCQVRLSIDSRYFWLILVPKLDGETEVHELSEADQVRLIKESSKVATALNTVVNPEKINVANLGNVVAQLHWHVVARFKNDEAWPGPIWGVGNAKEWDTKKRAEFIDSFLNELTK